VPAHGADWEQVTPNILITSSHLAAFGTVTPLGGSEWHATTSGSVTRTIPTWAIVLCVLLIWVCLLGLLFLAVKEERYTGEVTVSVRAADGRSWSESVPVSSTSARDHLLNRVSWAQTVTSHAAFNQR